MERNDIKQTENEQAEVAAQVAEAKITEGATATEASLGKFKDVKSLLRAYENLESEFTRRSRKIKELEGEILKKNEEITQIRASSADGKISGNAVTDKKTDNDEKFKNVYEILSGGDRGENSPEEKNETSDDNKTPAEKNETTDETTLAYDAAKENRAAQPENEKTKTVTNAKTDGETKAETDVKARTEAEIKAEAENGGTTGEKRNESVNAGETVRKELAAGEKSDEKKNEMEIISPEEAVKAYLLSVFRNKPVAPPVFGTAVTAPPKKPRTFEEAGKLVKTTLGL